MARAEVEQRHLELFGDQKVFQEKHIAHWAVQIKQARKARG